MANKWTSVVVGVMGLFLGAACSTPEDREAMKGGPFCGGSKTSCGGECVACPDAEGVVDMSRATCQYKGYVCPDPDDPDVTTGADASSSGGESTSGESTSGESTSGESTSGESTSGESTTGESTSGTTTTGGPELTCAYFCARQPVACPAFAYADEPTCLSTCATWPEGTPDDTHGDTLGCRLHYADAGEMCINTTPSGGDECIDDDGLSCANYCATFFANCADYNVYADDADCRTKCSGWAPGEPGDFFGDSIACRLENAVNAANLPSYHCPEASPDSGMCH